MNARAEEMEREAPAQGAGQTPPPQGPEIKPLPGTSRGHKRSIELLNKLRDDLAAEARERRN